MFINFLFRVVLIKIMNEGCAIYSVCYKHIILLCMSYFKKKYINHVCLFIELWNKPTNDLHHNLFEEEKKLPHLNDRNKCTSDCNELVKIT